MREIVLVSSSPRRRELLKRIVPFFDVINPVVSDENLDTSDPIKRALKKMEGIRLDKEKIYLSFDTIVVVDSHILGKPRDREAAFKYLKMLSGRWHSVFTGVVALKDGILKTELVKSDVKFRELGIDEIEFYLDTGEPFDKAGGYGIQGFAEAFVEEIRGSYSNIVGLPIAETYAVLRRLGYKLKRYVSLKEFADVVRSKNAGPFLITVDIMFDDDRKYSYFKKNKILTVENFAMYMGINKHEITVFEYYDQAKALKITFRRTYTSGSVMDDDVYGATFYVKLLDFPVPVKVYGDD